MPKKPSCSDFIVEAIRQTRPVRKGLKPGASSGKALHSIFELAQQFYSEIVFQRSVNALIKNGVLLLVALSTGTNGNWYPKKFPRIPPGVPLRKSWWYLDANGKSFVGGPGKHASCMHQIVLYVIADGLPTSVAKVTSNNVTMKAEQIMASVQQKKT